jgi:peptidoglycan hydrolase-like protein with peptidoglycan-binding domain
MNKFKQAMVLTAVTASSFGVGEALEVSEVQAAPQVIEQGYPNLPNGCDVVPVGSTVSKSREDLLVEAGFSGIKRNGKLDELEQRATYGAQKFMKEIGVIGSGVEICGVLGSATEAGVKKMLNPSTLAGESQISQSQASKNNTPNSTARSKEKKYSIDDCRNFDDLSIDTVKAIQRALGVKDDGVFGNITCNAMINFQETNGIAQYGKGFVGQRTAGALGVNLNKKTQANNAEFSPAEDCPRPTSCDVSVSLITQRLSVVSATGITLWNIPVHSGKLGMETRAGSGKLGPVEYGPGRNPERKSIDYPEATLVNPRGFGNGGQKIHGSYSFNANAVNNPKSGSAGCIRVSNSDSFVLAQMPSGTDVNVYGAKPGTQQRYFR